MGRRRGDLEYHRKCETGMTGKKRLRALLLLFVASCGLHGQENVYFTPQAEESFLLGVRQFVQQDYANAYQTLRRTSELAPMHQRTTAAIIMAAKSANALRSYEDAADLCRNFLERFPFSSYVEDAHYTLGMAYAGLNRMRDAASEMVIVSGTAHIDATRWRANECLVHDAFTFTPEVVRTLEAEAKDDSTRVLLTLLRGEAYLIRGMKDSAALAARSVMARSADKKILRRAQRLTAVDGEKSAGDTLTIGVLLPFMNQYRVEKSEGMTSKEIMRGIREALRDYNAEAQAGRVPVKLDVQDSQREKGMIDRIIGAWRNDSSVVAILGPLFTDETIAAATQANRSQIPLITPTATGNNIASIGEYVFQASPDYRMRGVLMAQYAVQTAAKKNFAIITSDEFPASLLAEAFAKEVARLGANVISFQHYAAGTSDFRPLFRAMKTDAARLQHGAIEALYCPIASSSEIGVMASQIRMLDSKLVVLGSDEWNDDEQLDRNKTSADGIIFTSDKWASDPSQPISGLSFESFGYDAASLLFDCLNSAAGTRRSLQSVLSHVSEFDGIHSKISFQPGRVNTHLHVLQYKKGFIKKIGEVEYRQ
jgi:branched-chain amino acid transport system substrate-binding protein